MHTVLTDVAHHWCVYGRTQTERSPPSLQYERYPGMGGIIVWEKADMCLSLLVIEQQGTTITLHFGYIEVQGGAQTTTITVIKRPKGPFWVVWPVFEHATPFQLQTSSQIIPSYLFMNY